MTSHERFFHKNAKELDDQFTEWLKQHAPGGVELRILCQDRLDATQWVKLKQDVKDILNGQLDGTAAKHRVRGAWNIVLQNIAPEYQPLSTTRISSVVFISAGAHKNEQNKFIEDLRKGCSNLVKHTKDRLTLRVPFFSCASAQMRRSATAPTGLASTSPSFPTKEWG